MSRGAKITKAVKRAKREQPKKRKAKKRTSAPAGIHPPDGGWADGESVIIAAGDRALLRVGAKLVKNACKNAARLNGSLDIAKGEAERRMVEADGIIALLDEADSRSDVTIPPHLRRCAQIGTSYEWNKVQKMKKDQEAASIEDTKALDKRLRELDRLATHLGIQGSLAVESAGEEAECDQEDFALE